MHFHSNMFPDHLVAISIAANKNIARDSHVYSQLSFLCFAQKQKNHPNSYTFCLLELVFTGKRYLQMNVKDFCFVGWQTEEQCPTALQPN